MAETLPANFIEFVELLIERPIVKSNHDWVAKLPIDDLADIHDQYGANVREFYTHTGSSAVALRRCSDATYFPHLFKAEGALVSDPREFFRKLNLAPKPLATIEREPGEFRPLLDDRVNIPAILYGGYSASTFEQADHEARIATLKNLLLYAHRVMIPDTLFRILEFVISREDDDFVKRSRVRLANFLDFLFAIAPLVRQNIVMFYPSYEREFLPGVSFSDYQFEVWLEKTGKGPNIGDFAAAGGLHKELLRHFLLMERFRANLFLSSRGWEAVLQFMLEYGAEKLHPGLQRGRDQKMLAESAILSRLHAAQIFDLRKLDLDDIINIRRADAFQGWREHLKQGLSRLEVGADNQNLTKEFVTEALRQGADSVKTEISKSTYLSDVGGHFKSFMVGAIAAAPFAADFRASLATGGVALVLNSIVSLCQYTSGANPTAAQQESVLRHYEMLEVE